MSKALLKDILITIRKGRKRFIAILAITLLGVTMFSGLKAGCVDLRYTADRFFDQQRLHDISILSTLGLTEDDVKALQSLSIISRAEGIYAESVIADYGGTDYGLRMVSMEPDGLDLPYIQEGRLPETENECVVTQKFLDDIGASLGDSITIRETLDPGDEDTDPESPSFPVTTYTITGTVIDPEDINNPSGAMSAYRSNGTKHEPAFILRSAIDTEVYTSVVLSVDGASELFCFDDSYEDLVAEVRALIEDHIKEQRENARYEQVSGDAYAALEDAETAVREELDDALQKLRDAEKELNYGSLQLEEAEQQIRTASAELADGRRQLEEGRAELQTQDAAAREMLQSFETLLSDTSISSADQAVQALSEKDDAQQLLGELWPENEWTDAVQSVSDSTEALVNSAIAEVNLDQLDPTTVSGLTDAINRGDTSAAIEAIGVLVGNPRPEDISAAISNIMDGTDLSSASGSTQALTLAYSSAAAVRIAEKQLQIELLLSTGDGSSETEARIQELQSQQDALRDYSTSIASIAARYASAVGLGNSMVTAQDELGERKVEMESQLTAAWALIEENEQKLTEGEKQLAESLELIEENRQKLTDGQRELKDGFEEYEDGKAEAAQKLADARKEIERIDMATWYVQDRKSLDSYNNILSDADSIESIGTVFPFAFLLIAVLISLTTITRMVEEDRGLIGTYKALGFTDSEVCLKYVVYSAAAAAIGGVFGTLCAFVGLPLILLIVFRFMYLLPGFVLCFTPGYGLAGPLLFILGIVGAAVITCYGSLRQMPAALMRPKTPRSGSRVFLEYITPLWSRLSFLNKVTARNLFRYKKRLFMTIFGIAGCTALLLFGFAVKDSVHDLVPRQYERTFQYDLLAAVQPADNELLLDYMDSSEVSDALNFSISTATLRKEDQSLSVQLCVLPKTDSLDGYIFLYDQKGHELLLDDDRVCITRNAANVMKFAAGDTISIRTLDLMQKDLQVSAITENYMSNYIYMTAACYEKYFGAYEPNAVLVHYADPSAGAVFAEQLKTKDGIFTCMDTASLEDQFDSAFMLINMVVYIIIILSAALAFVVLFTLSTTNISEREREIATIKVLGFYDREVHLYIDKETYILTLFGILIGMPLGYLFAQSLSVILTLPNMYLAVSLHPLSYFIAGGLTILFALLVNLITDRSLDHVNPVEALKSVE